MTQPYSFLEPIVFEPIYKEKPWGGQRLKQVLSKNIPFEKPIGESWELSDVAANRSIAASGHFQGLSIHQIIASNRESLLGEKVTGEQFPLLFKFIDANEKLSVQVHPDDRYALSRGLGNGKTECWYIVETGAGTELMLGFKKGTDLPLIKESIRKNNLEKILNKIRIAQGDVLFIPAGCVHAIPEGTLAYEVQQTSDVTYRLYDWGRVDAHGLSRDLHIKESLAAVNVSLQDMQPIPPLCIRDTGILKQYIRIVCSYFSLEEFIFSGTGTDTIAPKSSYAVVTVLEGILGIVCDERKEITFSKGYTMLLPAEMMQRSVTIHGENNTRFLLCAVPDIPGEIINPLRRSGKSDESIARLGGLAQVNDIIPLL